MTALCEYDLDELTDIVIALGEKKYRAGQIMRHVTAFDGFGEYSDVPKAFVRILEQNYIDRAVTETTRVVSSDGAVKYLFVTHDGKLIESVFLPHDYGNSVCVSCQVGCAMGCLFCASGHYGLERNLSAGEILAQVLYIARDQKDNGGVKKVVMMGSGSPLANYENTVKFIRLITSPNGLNIGMRNISVSTCGIPDKIDALARDGFCGTLSLSLHAATDEKRKTIMRIANSYTVKQNIDALKRFFGKTGRRVVIEYILIGGFNDTDDDATKLKDLLKGVCCHVNLIPLNKTEYCDLVPCSKKRAYAFCDRLNKLGVSATVRRSMGSDVAGACGQLKNRTNEKRIDKIT